MKVLLIDNTTENLEHLESLLSGHEVTILEHTEINNKLEGYDLIILSGAREVLPVTYNSKNFDSEKDLIKNSNTPIIGICYGAELIAAAFNCKLEESNEKVEEIINIETIKDDPIFNGLYEFEVYESHRFNIIELSDQVEGYAKSDNGYEIIKHTTKDIWGLQFHPEKYVDETSGDEIFLNIIENLNINNK